MKLLGILGGMSWESSAHLYGLLNREVSKRLGGLHSAHVLLHSVDFADVEVHQRSGNWAAAAEHLSAAGAGLKAAGAQALLLATNTMHVVADEIESSVGLPLLHLVDVTAAALRARGVHRAGLLATRYTMEHGFYHQRMYSHGIELITLASDERADVHRIIYEELCRGQVLDASRERYEACVRALVSQGAEAVILGCTEIGLLLDESSQSRSPVPLLDSTVLQAQAAVDWMLSA